jgi:udp-glucose 6-dehydrogenase
VNEAQKHVLFEKFVAHYGGQVKGRKVAVWGLAFKPETDDMRQAPSVVLIESLLQAGCEVAVFDPVAMDEARRYLGQRVRYAEDLYSSALDVDAIFHVTEWKAFRMPTWEVLRRSVREPLLIDGRNVFDREPVEAGFTLLQIGQ